MPPEKLQFNPERLNELKALEMPDLIKELLDVYFQSSPGRIQEMQAGLAAGDPAKLAAAAHSLKSASAGVGADRLADLCAQLEAAGKAGDISQSGDNLARVLFEYDAIKVILEKERG